MNYVGRITVEDASGCQFQLHEFRGRGLLLPQSRFELETGEAVTRLDHDNYVITKTGETLVRSDAGGEKRN